MRDLVTEISYACDGDADSFAYLRQLSREDWEEQEYALGAFLQEGRFHDPDWLRNFVAIIEMILDHHGRDVLQQYLQSSFYPSRAAAMEVLELLPADELEWAVDDLDAIAVDEDVVTRGRNRAAALAAKIAGRGEPEPLNAPWLKREEGVLSRALEELDFDDYDARGAIIDCANAMGEQVAPMLREQLDAWLRAAERPHDISLAGFIGGIKVLRAYLLELLVSPNPLRLDALRLARMALREEEGVEELEGLLSAQLAGEEELSEEELRAAQQALRQRTGEHWIEELGHKNYEIRLLALGSLDGIAPRYLARQGLGLVDALYTHDRTWGWGEDCEQIVAAIERADRAEFVEVVARGLRDDLEEVPYWRAAPFFMNSVLIEFLGELGPFDWAEAILARLEL